MSAQTAPKEVFLSYAEADKDLGLELEEHLSVLRREGVITTWHKGQIGAGSDTSQERGEHLSKASVIVLLLSAGFVASEACYEVEMQQALARHQAGETWVILVLLRPMDTWQNTPLGSLQTLPSNGIPVTMWSDRHAAFADVAQGIRSVLQDGTLPATATPPSPLPGVWNIPYARNPFFTGRDELLTRLATTLKVGQATALSQAQAISGLGGIGKTQIAVEYAYQHRDEYEVVLWVLADTRESLVSGYIAIAKLLNLAEKDEQDQAVIIEAVKNWLQTHDSWLLILDNADDLKQAYDFLPPTFGGHLLLTTRAYATGTRAGRLEVEVMPPEVGALFLLRRAKLVGPGASLNDAAASDVVTARAICEELAGLPLALDQAGAFIEESQCSLWDYQQRYRKRRAALLQRRGELVNDHPEPVATTWSLSFEKVEKKSPVAADLLRLCAFLHPDAIPVELIIGGAAHLGPLLARVAEDEMALDDAIVTLGVYSLIRREALGKTLSLHRLVQTVQRDAMDEEMRHLWTGRAVFAVHAVFPEVEFSTWPQCERYLPHALLCAELIEQEHLTLLEGANLLSRIGSYLQTRGQYSEAESVKEQALLIYEQQLGKDHPDVANSLNNLAELYRAQGRYEKAEPLFQRALAICEQVYGPEHPAVAIILNNLALLYDHQGKYEMAEPLFQRALSIRERKLGAMHPLTASSLNNLAFLYNHQGKYEMAEPLFQRALAVDERELGAMHPNTAMDLNNLAALYYARGKYEMVEPLFQRALAIDENAYGLEHPEVATDLNNLAALYGHQGKYEMAEPLYQRALSIRERKLGAMHPDAANSLHNLATLYHEQGKYDEAEPLFKRALLVLQQTLGETHPNSQTVRQWYVSLLRKMGRDSEADLVEAGGGVPDEMD
jgi:tetratricopeptide (TPR) repeat protein